MFMMHTPFGCIYILKSGITQFTDIDHHRLRSKVKIARAYSRKYDMDWHRMQEMDKRHAYTPTKPTAVDLNKTPPLYLHIPLFSFSFIYFCTIRSEGTPP